jgi:hypothetical protein
MIPQHDNIYYFEITIKKGAKRSSRYVEPTPHRVLGNSITNSMLTFHSFSELGLDLAVGFCEENMQMSSMLGMTKWSWGYHGDDGRCFDDQNSEEGRIYGLTYDQGDTIGCGVNFAENLAFYTKNGEIIGTYASWSFYSCLRASISPGCFRYQESPVPLKANTDRIA